MKKAIYFQVLIFFVCTNVLASDVIIYQGEKQEDVAFPHKAHAEKLGDCSKCHEGTPALIVFDKKGAHNEICADCHEAMGGPVACEECHRPHDNGVKCKECHKVK